MITPEDFVLRWNQFRASEPALADDDDSELQVATPQSVVASAIPDAAKRFLVTAGLPKTAAPWMSFSGIAKGLPRLWEVYAPHSWTELEKQRVRQYLFVGSDCDDNPICLDEAKNGEVVILDHNDGFSSRQFVNSSVPQLAECLLTYLACPVSPHNLKEAFAAIDAAALQEGSSWWWVLCPDGV